MNEIKILKKSKRENCLELLKSMPYVKRTTFEADRLKYGTSFIRRLEEIGEEYEVFKFNEKGESARHHDFIVTWKLGRKFSEIKPIQTELPL